MDNVDDAHGQCPRNHLAEVGPACSPVTRDCTEVLWNKKCCRLLKTAEGGVVSVLV